MFMATVSMVSFNHETDTTDVQTTMRSFEGEDEARSWAISRMSEMNENSEVDRQFSCYWDDSSLMSGNADIGKDRVFFNIAPMDMYEATVQFSM